MSDDSDAMRESGNKRAERNAVGIPLPRSFETGRGVATVFPKYHTSSGRKSNTDFVEIKGGMFAEQKNSRHVNAVRHTQIAVNERNERIIPLQRL